MRRKSVSPSVRQSSLDSFVKKRAFHSKKAFRLHLLEPDKQAALSCHIFHWVEVLQVLYQPTAAQKVLEDYQQPSQGEKYGTLILTLTLLLLGHDSQRPGFGNVFWHCGVLWLLHPQKKRTSSVPPGTTKKLLVVCSCLQLSSALRIALGFSFSFDSKRHRYYSCPSGWWDNIQVFLEQKSWSDQPEMQKC